MNKKIVLHAKNIGNRFKNKASYCVGTGRMGLALQREYYEQLSLVQEHIGFEFIRGHGLLCDDMAIYQEYEDAEGNIKAEYNFNYLDTVMDNYLSLNIKPFLELGFMPEKMASGTQTVFYWKGNVTPPKSYEAWNALVQATLMHLIERYGAAEVTSWPVEVWNEPNLDIFWENADMHEYFKLFESTIYAVKAVDKRFRVGGPAVCGGTDVPWITTFLNFCEEKKLPLDFVTRHHYTIQKPESEGHYRYSTQTDPNEGLQQLHTTREIVESHECYKGMQIHITEFNTSYTPQSPVHDTNYNAAYIAYLLSRLGDDNESYSYWTFGDVFEESGVPFTLFHGGFGLVAKSCIPKPTFWSFAFYKALQGDCVIRSENAVFTKCDKVYNGVLWNMQLDENRQSIELSINLPSDASEYYVIIKKVDKACCNPLKVWHDMGEPQSPSYAQIDILRQSAYPQIVSERVKSDAQSITLDIILPPDAVYGIEIKPVVNTTDRGYDYERVMRYTKE